MKDFLKQRSSYYYDLPDDLIAQFPVKDRSTSRLMFLNRSNGKITHNQFTDLIEYLRPDDILVLNRTKVIPARLYGKKPSGSQVEILLLNQEDKNISPK